MSETSKESTKKYDIDNEQLTLLCLEIQDYCQRNGLTLCEYLDVEILEEFIIFLKKT